MQIVKRAVSVFCNRVAFPLYQNTIGLCRKKKEVKRKYHFVKDRDNVVIVGVPNHGNLGDYAIYVAERELWKRKCPDKNVIGVSMTDFQHEVAALKSILSKRDFIVLTGGGNLGNQYMDDENIRRTTIQLFPQNRIVMFPQTLYFTEDAEGEQEKKRTAEIYNSHKRLILLARDAYSYQKMQTIFTVPVRLMPDVVLTMMWHHKRERKGALLLLRRDVERKLDSTKEATLERRLLACFKNVKKTDTEISYQEFIRNPEGELARKIEQVGGCELVITDRLHGMVFAAITETPCIVLDNYNHKIKETYSWVSHLNYIRYASEEEQIDSIVRELMSLKQCTYDNEKILKLYENCMQEIMYGQA